jgi:ABC-type transport system substrate-binding protein
LKAIRRIPHLVWSIPFAALLCGMSGGLPPSELRVGALQRPNGTGPTLWDHEPSRQLISWTHDTLFEFTLLNGVPSVRPVLAAEPISWSKDQKVARIRIRPGVRFNPPSERPLEAGDFVESWKRLASLPEGSIARRHFADRIQESRAISSLELEIRLKEPDAELESKLALGFTAPSWTGAGEAAGTGPWVLETWHPGKGAFFAANRGYSNSFLEPGSGALPRVDSLRQLWFRSEDEAMAAFEAGKIDILPIPGTLADRARALSRSKASSAPRLYEGFAPEFTVAVLNLRTLKDRSQRARVAAAMDRDFWTSATGADARQMGSRSLPRLDDWGVGSPSQEKRAGTNSRRRALTSQTIRVDWVTPNPDFAVPDAAVSALASRLEEEGLGVSVENHVLQAASLRFRSGLSDVVILGWKWNYPSAREIMAPLVMLQPETAPEMKALTRAAAASGPTRLEPLAQALESGILWSAGPRQNRLVLVQPWVVDYEPLAFRPDPEKYAATDRALRRRLSKGAGKVRP